MRKSILFLSVLAAVLANACGDDSQPTIAISCSISADCNTGLACVAQACVPQITVAGGDCTASSDLCAEPLTCENNVCVQYVDEGESCGEYLLCPDALVCQNNTCQPPPPPEGTCDETIGLMCPAHQICIDGKCQNKAGEGETCNDVILCADGLFCHEGTCLDQSLECAPGLVCADDEACIEGQCLDAAPVGTSCEILPCVKDASCIQGVCLADLNEGEACGNHTGKCKAPLFCNIGKCMAYIPLGGTCDAFINICDPALSCENKQCVQLAKAGEECHPKDFIECAAPYVCAYETPESEKGTCVAQVETGEECHAMKPCMDKDVCIMGQCVTNKGECENDTQCSADSYCCLDENCDTKNVCIPYGTGPRGDTDETCSYETVIGLFEAALQCEWVGPAADDLYPKHHNVLSTPTVIDTPHDSGDAVEIVVPTYNYTDGGDQSAKGSDAKYYGVIRIFNGETCELLESIYDPQNHVIASSPLTIADVDNDSHVEIIAQRAYAHASSTARYGLVMFKWDETDKKYKTAWATSETSATSRRWDGPSMHDINNDGKPEIISLGEVFDAQTGKRLNPANSSPDITLSNGAFSVVGDIDNDGTVELLSRSGIHEWDATQNQWITQKAFKMTGYQFAYADFGIPGATAADFNYYAMDGIAEIVATGSGVVQLYTQDGQQLMSVAISSGGAPTIGDFDNDGFPEIGVASYNKLGIYDPLCQTADEHCEGKNILWQRVTQDQSSMTGASLFDFDGDGQVEVLYGEECFTRIYDGKSGDVLFSSYRTSCTWYENPIVADTDRDSNAEIIVNSNDNCGNSCPVLDSSHGGLLCVEDSDCISNTCVDGFCRCTDNTQCNSSILGGDGSILEYQCTTPLINDGKGNVCRAVHMAGVKQSGFRVLRDRLDRWASSRPIWNQHAYAITNINDDQTIPKTSEWLQNFKQEGLNNYRQNAQGAVGRDTAPDITGYFVQDDVCGVKGDTITVGAMVCNRGTKMVASRMPATFYQMNDDGSEKLLCTSYTESNVPIGGCMRVSCEFTLDETGVGARKIRMVSNDDGQGGRTTVECNEQNNEDIIQIDGCAVN